MKKALLIILLVVVTITISLTVICYTQKDKLVKFGMEKAIQSMEMVMLKNLPSSISEDEARKTINNFFAKMKAGQVDQEISQKLTKDFQEAIADQKIESTEITDLLEQMKKACQ